MPVRRGIPAMRVPRSVAWNFKIREASHRFGLKLEVEVFDLRGDLLYETGRLAAVQRAVVVRETQTHIRNETVDASAQILRRGARSC